jgi:hypothetical protein
VQENSCTDTIPWQRGSQVCHFVLIHSSLLNTGPTHSVFKDDFSSPAFTQKKRSTDNNDTGVKNVGGPPFTQKQGTRHIVLSDDEDASAKNVGGPPFTQKQGTCHIVLSDDDDTGTMGGMMVMRAVQPVVGGGKACLLV